MEKYRASILLLCAALFFVGLHYYFGWQDYVIESEEMNTIATHNDWLYRFAKEETEAFPAEVITLALELALFAGIFQMFKPYDPDTEKIKQLEESMDERLKQLEVKHD